VTSRHTFPRAQRFNPLTTETDPHSPNSSPKSTTEHPFVHVLPVTARHGFPRASAGPLTAEPLTAGPAVGSAQSAHRRTCGRRCAGPAVCSPQVRRTRRPQDLESPAKPARIHSMAPKKPLPNKSIPPTRSARAARPQKPTLPPRPAQKSQKPTYPPWHARPQRPTDPLLLLPTPTRPPQVPFLDTRLVPVFDSLRDPKCPQAQPEFPWGRDTFVETDNRKGWSIFTKIHKHVQSTNLLKLSFQIVEQTYRIWNKTSPAISKNLPLGKYLPPGKNQLISIRFVVSWLAPPIHDPSIKFGTSSSPHIHDPRVLRVEIDALFNDLYEKTRPGCRLSDLNESDRQLFFPVLFIEYYEVVSTIFK
jgi:hypothetical protein